METEIETEASETVDRTPSGHTADDVREVFNRAPPGVPYFVDDKPCRPPMPDAVAQDMRLKRCGLVWYEDQLDSRRWVSRPGIVAGSARVKVLPLSMVEPTPELEITALDGEKYFIPKDFKGDWFSVAGPSGRKLIP